MTPVPENQELFAQIQSLQSDPAIRQFIENHEKNDVRALALKSLPNSGWPRALIMDQIRARQIARRKAPFWLSVPGIIFPAAEVMEQSSSQAAAAYKASLVNGGSFADLGAGAGMDSAAFARRFKSGFCVECDAQTVFTLEHNLTLLLDRPPEIYTEKADDYVRRMPQVDLVYIDPQRRKGGRRGLIGLEETSPDVVSLLPALRQRAQAVMVKTSPVLDIEKAAGALESTAAVHIVEWQGKCREILYIIKEGAPAPDHVPITAVTIDDKGDVVKSMTFTRAENADVLVTYSSPQSFIYEPSPAFIKAGGFGLIARRFGLSKLHPHTHLYTSDKALDNFPGRVFVVQDILAVDKKAVGQALASDRAHLTVRNFPDSVEALRKRLKLRDGGDDYLFACTLQDERRVLLHCRKAEAEAGAGA